MGAKYDSERLLSDIRDFLQADLPAKLIEITTEKGDAIVLDSIPNSSYYINEVPLDTNIKLFLTYSLQSVSAVTAGQSVALTYDIAIIIGHWGLKNLIDDTIHRTLMRYTRAAKEVLSKRFADLGGLSKLSISEHPARPEVLLATGELLRVGGLVVTATIA